MLQTILGLDAAAIASAFLVSPAAMGQRLSRAKAKIRLAGVPFKIPEREDLPERLGVALEAIYAAFSHGWAEAFSDDPRGRNLAEEAIWLGRVVVSLIPNEPEAMGLLALMLYAHARREARRDAQGRYVPLSDQAVERWDQPAIEEAEGLLHAAGAIGRAGTLPARGRGSVGSRRSPADRNDGLGGDRRPLRCALRPDRVSRRRRQSRGGGRPRAWGRGRIGIAGRGGARKAASPDSNPIGWRGPIFARNWARSTQRAAPIAWRSASRRIQPRAPFSSSGWRHWPDARPRPCGRRSPAQPKLRQFQPSPETLALTVPAASRPRCVQGRS